MTRRRDGDVVPEIHQVSGHEGRALADGTARKLLGISSAEFLVRWYRGDFQDEQEDMAVTKLATLIPPAR